MSRCGAYVNEPEEWAFDDEAEDGRQEIDDENSENDDDGD